MRSTRDIIIAAKDGLPITEDELRMALLVMAAVDAFTWRELYELIEVIEEDKPGQAATKAAFAKSVLERMFQAKREDPAKWLGAGTPGTAKHDRWLKISKGLLDKIEEGIREPVSPDLAKPRSSRAAKATPATPPAGDLEATEKARHKKPRSGKVR